MASAFLPPYKIILAYQRLTLAKIPALKNADSDCQYEIAGHISRLARIAFHEPRNFVNLVMYKWFRENIDPTLSQS